jgi:hypothetical protein
MKYFEAFGESGYHSAFMTTYAFGALAFEDVPFPKLRGAGCRNILVLADRQMLNQASSEFGPPKFAGSSYHIVKADAPRAFHPKITMLIGATKGRLIVGSANLTALGLGGNKELVASILYTPELTDHARYFAGALAYIRRYVPTDDPWFSTGLQRAIRGAPWLRAATESAASDDVVNDDLALLIDRPDITFLDQIVAHIGSDPIKRLIVISPYWDMKLEGLARLRTLLGEPVTDLLIEKSSGKFPKQELHRFLGLELFDIERRESGRFVHAKLIVAQGDSWDHVVSGSMNCTYPALMALSKLSGNAEAGIYRRVPPGTALEGLSLETYREAPLPASSISEMTYLSTEDANNVTHVDGGTLVFQAGRLSWHPPSKLASEAITLTLFARDGQKIGEGFTLRSPDARSWHPSFESIRPKYGDILFADGSTSAPVQIVDLDVLSVATLPPQRGRKRKLMDDLVDTFNEDLILIETLNQLEALEIEEDGATDERVVQANAPAPEAAVTKEYGVVPYEEFTRARSLSRAKGGAAQSLLDSRRDSAANMLSRCLNRLIGLVSHDLGADEDQDIRAIDAFDFSTTEPQAPLDPDQSMKNGDQPRSGSKNAEAKSSAKKMLEAVNAFEARCKSLKGKPVRTAEIVRLRALIQIILSHAKAVKGISLATQILPVYVKEGFDWPRLVGRLLMQHFGVSSALQQLQVELDEGEQQRVIEYMALANWAAQAALIAVKSHKDAVKLRPLIERTVSAVRTQTEAIVSVISEDKNYFEEVSSKLDQRFGARLGLR